MEKTRNYEIAYVVDAQLGPEEITAIKDRMAELAKGQGAQMGEIVQWDRRRMAYSIRGKREGIYIFMPMKASADAIAEVVRNLRLSDAVLRHLVLRTDED